MLPKTDECHFFGGEGGRRGEKKRLRGNFKGERKITNFMFRAILKVWRFLKLSTTNFPKSKTENNISRRTYTNMTIRDIKRD